MAGEGISRRSSYDYVIVGSGAGGGLLACNLAKAGQRVLLLEAGGDHENYNYQMPVFHALATGTRPGATTRPVPARWD